VSTALGLHLARMIAPTMKLIGSDSSFQNVSTPALKIPNRIESVVGHDPLPSLEGVNAAAAKPARADLTSHLESVLMVALKGEGVAL
jgi:hypothetical protein